MKTQTVVIIAIVALVIGYFIGQMRTKKRLAAPLIPTAPGQETVSGRQNCTPPMGYKVCRARDGWCYFVRVNQNCNDYSL